KRRMVVKEVAHGCAPISAIIAAPGRINPGPDVISGSNSDPVSLESGALYEPFSARFFATSEKYASSPQQGVLASAFVSCTCKNELATASKNSSAPRIATFLIIPKTVAPHPQPEKC